MSIPRKDSLLLDWTTNANARLNAQPAIYGTTPEIAAQYTAVHQVFVDSYNDLVAARTAGTRSESQTSIKDNAKQALLDFARPLYRTIQVNKAVSDSDKIQLGITLANTLRTTRAAPAAAPVLRVVSVDGRLVSLTLRDADNPDSRALPHGIDGAIVMSHAGPTPAADAKSFKIEGLTSRTTMEVLFPAIVAPGTQVWLTAAWFDNRKQMGPAAKAVGTQINYGGSMQMAA